MATNVCSESQVADYTDWINKSKQTLKERDFQLLTTKARRIEATISSELNTVNFRINQTTIDNTLQVLRQKIDSWGGVSIKRTKTSVSSFNAYFDIGKKWYDQQKAKLLGSIFWVPIFDQIQQFVSNDRLLLLRSLKVLFDGNIKYSNTKMHSLINAGTITNSTVIHTYLNNFSNSIDISQWMQDCTDTRKRAKTIENKVQNEFRTLLAAQSMRTNPSNVANTANPTVHSVRQTPINYIPQTFATNNNNNHIMGSGSVQPIYFRPPNLIMNAITILPLTLNYGGFHQQFYVVSSNRYTPLGRSPLATTAYNPAYSTYNLPPISSVNTMQF